MNVICILLDSLNRHFLPAYGNDWVKTPNLDRLAQRAATFTQNYIGSMPCMPTRRDLWTGTIEFPWRPWGSLEPYDNPLPRVLKQDGVMTMLVSDHYHLWEAGGENYHVDFEGWEFIRGHENDPWATEPAAGPAEVRGALTPRYRRNMARFSREEDYLSPRTLRTAAEWLELNHDAHDRFFLMVDEFDPHEPFHVPPPYDTMYDPDYTGPFFVWPNYGRPEYTEAEIRHIRAQYAGKVTMADRWLGRLLDRMDDFKLWDNTMLIVMTDHGHFLGEHGWFGKPPCPQYEAIAHRPLFIHMPGEVCSGRRIGGLSTTVDLHATILDAYGITPPGPCHGRSLLPLFDGEQQVRDSVLYGWFGGHMQVTDGRCTYIRGAKTESNGPLNIYTNRWSTAPWWRIPMPDSRYRCGDFIPHAQGMPMGCMPVDDDIKRQLHCPPEAIVGGDFLFDTSKDPNERENLVGTELEQEYIALMRRSMQEIGVPQEQYERLGLG